VFIFQKNERSKHHRLFFHKNEQNEQFFRHAAEEGKLHDNWLAKMME
jgi:hypothetical protein